MIRRRRPRPKLSRTSRALTRLSPAPLLDPNVASPRPLDEADEATRQNRRAVRGVVLLAVLMLAAGALGYALIQHYKDVGTQARGKLQDTLQQRYDGLAAQVRAGKDVAGQVTAACSDPNARKVLVAEGVSCAQAATVATSTPTALPTAQPGQTGAQGSQGASGRGIVASTVVSGSLILTYSDGTAVDVGAITGPSGADGKPGSAGQNGSNGSNGQSGSDGRGIASTVITASGHLTVTYTNGQTVDLGTVIGPTGSSGSNGAAGSNGVDGKDGQQGQAGASGAAGPSGAAGQNGADGQPGNPPASFTFTVPGLLGGTTYDCEPTTPATPGTQPAYSCAAQPTPTPTPSPTGAP